MLKYTIIYTDCVAKTCGDFAAAGEFAYTLKQNFLFSADNVCVLASSNSGINIFKKLYGNNSNSELNIHGESFGVVILSEFVNNHNKGEVVSYIEVARCKPAPMALVNKIIDPLSTKILFVSLPHCTLSGLELYAAQQYPEAHSNNNVHVISTGLGPDRVGIPLYDGPFVDIDHQVYCGITKDQFGFTYFNSNLNDASKFISDYLKIASLAYATCKNYVFVSDCSNALEGIKYYAMISGKIIDAYDFSQQKAYLIKINQAKGTLEVLGHDFKLANDGADTTIINIALLPGVSNEKMRALMNASIHFSGSTGIASEVEALAFGKIALYQFMQQNEVFITSYRQSVLDSNIADKSKSARFLELQVWKKKLSQREVKEFVGYLNDKSFCQQFTLFNTKLIRSSNKVVSAVNNALGLIPRSGPVSQP